MKLIGEEKYLMDDTIHDGTLIFCEQRKEEINVERPCTPITTYRLLYETAPQI